MLQSLTTVQESLLPWRSSCQNKLAYRSCWTRLEVEFTPSPRDPFLLIKLCVEGTGTAWFDDLELMEVAR